MLIFNNLMAVNFLMIGFSNSIPRLRHFAYLSVLILMVAIIAGCTSQPQTSPPTPTISTISGGQSSPSVIAENKTGTQIVTETIAAAVADGTYTDDVTYNYHSGTETVKVSVTVKDDVITAASVIASDQAVPMSRRIIGNFNNALPDLVVGKKIDKLNIPTNVAGSSLTTAAFKGYIDNLIATK
jgi:uncharacterized protein with FMN-binding domain